MTITEFLTARLDEDETVARTSAVRVVFGDGYPGLSLRADRTIMVTPDRVLAEIAAKRASAALHPDVNDGNCGTCVLGQWGYPTHGGSTPSAWPCATLKALALSYAGHEDYDEEWRP